ncbi:MAG: DUF1987 domain-containing protein [Cytophagales bacterium]|nr:DUF1987 domain-containing protein [Cytophagales bacterium]MDW8384398.1 DUF1987 domain-containing protein [Flammeovirgaceae bacterium]
MEDFSLKGQIYIPEIYFDVESNELNFSGESYPEHAIKVYEPVYRWIDEYLKTPHRNIKVNFRMSYFNTSSSKCLLEILKKLEAYVLAGKGKAKVYWFYEEGDIDMLEFGEFFENDVKLPFEFCVIEK